MKKGLSDYLQSSPEFGLLQNIKGQKCENNLMSILQSHLSIDGNPGLLLNGYKVFSSLKNIFRSYNIKLRNCPNEQTQVEHDIVHIAPDGDQVNVKFVEAKATMQWNPFGHTKLTDQKLLSVLVKRPSSRSIKVSLLLEILLNISKQMKSLGRSILASR